jgi:cytochrome c
MKHLSKGLAGIVAALALNVAPALADGDAAAGEKVYKKCKTCHTLEAGQHRVGPSLAGMFGRTAGTADGFKFSKAMAGSGIVWDEASVDAYIANPKDFMPGNKMAFPGVKDAEDRADLIAYLKGATQ